MAGIKDKINIVIDEAVIYERNKNRIFSLNGTKYNICYFLYIKFLYQISFILELKEEY